MGKHKLRKYSSSDEDEWVEKDSVTAHESSNRSHKSKNRSKRKLESSSSSDERYTKHHRNSDDNIDKNREHNTEKPFAIRDEWMSLQSKFLTSNSERKREKDKSRQLERERQQYDPTKYDRELNPYWKNEGDGLPKFKKPGDSDSDNEKSYYKSSNNYKRTSNWRKKEVTSERKPNNRSDSDNNQTSNRSYWKKEDSRSDKSASVSKKPNTLDTANKSEEPTEYTQKDLNHLAAKLVKAEIMGNKTLIASLKEKLEKARNLVIVDKTEEVILTHTDSKGQSKPVRLQSEYGESSKGKKKRKTETHVNNERVRYFADDDKYSLKQMFENEKYTSSTDQDKEFLKSISTVRRNDDLDDFFSDNIRRKESDSKIDEKNKHKAISDHQKVSRSLDNCTKCLQSDSMLKHLMVSMGENIYLSVPSFEPLVEGHCMIVPIKHTPCSTQLDENEWTDIKDVKKALVKMFKAEKKCVVFFESAMNLHNFPHMVIECVPMPIEEGEMAPIYFKKAIDESEMEWAQNKKLVNLKGRDVRKAIPKGLSYFTVSFDLEEGFAHVIEDVKLFPKNFAQEIIGGMLDLHHSKWRKLKPQKFEEQSERVVKFSSKWRDFDCLTS